MALLRYSGYFPPLPDRPRGSSPPGDNALYRRDRLMEVESSWADGFWEVEVHRALRDRGEILAMAEDAVVTFEGGVGLSSMIRQRWAHARRYGAGRSKGLGTMARLARVAACPMVPPLLLGRIWRPCGREGWPRGALAAGLAGPGGPGLGLGDGRGGRGRLAAVSRRARGIGRARREPRPDGTGHRMAGSITPRDCR